MMMMYWVGASNSSSEERERERTMRGHMMHAATEGGKVCILEETKEYKKNGERESKI